jgi:hypothetical protein
MIGLRGIFKGGRIAAGNSTPDTKKYSTEIRRGVHNPIFLLTVLGNVPA